MPQGVRINSGTDIMVHDSFSSQSEGDPEFPQAFEMAEQFGTPPTRSRSIGETSRVLLKYLLIGMAPHCLELLCICTEALLMYAYVGDGAILGDQ